MEFRCQNRFCKFSSHGFAKFKICFCFDCGIWISIPKNYFTFEKLNFSTFWGPSLNGFAKFLKINHYWVPKGLTNFDWWFWNFHTLNYVIIRTNSLSCCHRHAAKRSIRFNFISRISFHSVRVPQPEQRTAYRTLL